MKSSSYKPKNNHGSFSNILPLKRHGALIHCFSSIDLKAEVALLYQCLGDHLVHIMFSSAIDKFSMVWLGTYMVGCKYTVLLWVRLIGRTPVWNHLVLVSLSFDLPMQSLIWIPVDSWQEQNNLMYSDCVYLGYLVLLYGTLL